MPFLTHRRQQIDEARRALEQSRADAPEVARLAGALRHEARKNNFADRVDASLRGHRT